jgi:hypothetical protein
LTLISLRASIFNTFVISINISDDGGILFWTLYPFVGPTAYLFFCSAKATFYLSLFCW